eukprot:CAMPEP_0183340510 /NCGR_PEP_ID=MMETSP0164_2-20130417/7040_1 /TAXON_ID=221442 /ORGANISM="Coccolithus pelagicus ssp braarudi, Strain PLY182g" /LENGTH=180 /DNA_ID=CAMNT_0025510661 /DNA_START=154 /DNA_END=693 /DNA_ORIENTATION=+
MQVFEGVPPPPSTTACPIPVQTLQIIQLAMFIIEDDHVHTASAFQSRPRISTPVRCARCSAAHGCGACSKHASCRLRRAVPRPTGELDAGGPLRQGEAAEHARPSGAPPATWPVGRAAEAQHAGELTLRGGPRVARPPLDGELPISAREVCDGGPREIRGAQVGRHGASLAQGRGRGRGR